MILVDDQSGSSALYPYIRALDPTAIMTRIEPPYGDIVWAGNGPDDVSLSVAVEYKKWSEFLDSQISGRIVGHQLIGMCQHYDRRYLLIEGRVRTDRNTGILQEQRGKEWRDVTRNGRALLYRDIEHWWTTLEEQTQTRVVRTFDEYESARWVFVKHSWWVNKGWDEHTALHQFHVKPPPTATLEKPTLVRRVAKELEGIGWDKSKAVEVSFPSVLELANASESRWRDIEGIGKTIASRVYKAIRGRMRE